MKVQRKKFVYQQRPLKNLLFEQEDIFAEEEPADEEAPADEPAAEEAGEGEGEAGAEAEGEAVEEEEEIEIQPEDEVKLSKSIDQDLEALMIDFETQARKSQEIEVEQEEGTITVEEGLSLKFLLEQEDVEYEEELDLDRFTAEVARLVKNYTSLLDMEKMLVNKAREFVVTRYGETAEKELLNILADKHDIEVVEPNEPPASELGTPISAYAGQAGAGGGA
jgi:hypothetical protein